jgi:hypothetical protein
MWCHLRPVLFAMWLELARRLTMIVLIVAISTGFAAPMAQVGSHHGQVIATMAMGTGGSGACAHAGCGIAQQADMQGTCFAPCAGVTVLSTAAPMSYFAAGHDVLAPSLALAMVDRAIRPEPHPPKQYQQI